MDSHNAHQDSTASNLSTSKVKTLKMIASAALKTRFYETYCRRQPFSFPDSLMHYIAKNPTSRKLYKKMVKSCKHFFVKNPILIAHILDYDDFKKKWTFSPNFEKSNEMQMIIGYDIFERYSINLDGIGCSKLWITERLRVYNNFSSVVPKIYRCDVEILNISNQIISYEDYCVISKCAKQIRFHNITVKNENGSITPFEKLIEAAPKLENVTFKSFTTLTNITSNTVQELIKLPNFSKITYLELNPIPETFDLDAFHVYMKEAINFTTFHLTFVNTISEAYKKHLEKIIDEILEAEEIDFMPPYINFVGIDFEKYAQLAEIYHSAHIFDFLL